MDIIHKSICSLILRTYVWTLRVLHAWTPFTCYVAVSTSLGNASELVDLYVGMVETHNIGNTRTKAYNFTRNMLKAYSTTQSSSLSAFMISKTQSPNNLAEGISVW